MEEGNDPENILRSEGQEYKALKLNNQLKNNSFVLNQYNNSLI